MVIWILGLVEMMVFDGQVDQNQKWRRRIVMEKKNGRRRGEQELGFRVDLDWFADVALPMQQDTMVIKNEKEKRKKN